ncbi:hypothetical protein HanPSC8_Chr03g0118931 [Helianthus annuus]|nr:hypothetical protein HanPSC8_Chr03g0118931 [Helianthus annuus]
MLNEKKRPWLPPFTSDGQETLTSQNLRPHPSPHHLPPPSSSSPRLLTTEHLPQPSSSLSSTEQPLSSDDRRPSSSLSSTQQRLHPGPCVFMCACSR